MIQTAPLQSKTCCTNKNHGVQPHSNKAQHPGLWLPCDDRFPIHDLRIFRPNRPGARTRQAMENAVAVDREAQVAVLADGMGGYNAGEIASGMAIAYIGTEIGSLAGPGRHCFLPPRDVPASAGAVCGKRRTHAISGASLSNPQYSGMGTTLAVGVFQCDQPHPRPYRGFTLLPLARGVLQQIAPRPFLVAGTGSMQAYRPGSRRAASSNRNFGFTGALGVEPHVQMEVNEFQVAPSDLFVMCSDGFDRHGQRRRAGRFAVHAWLSGRKSRAARLTPPMPMAVVITSAYCWCRRLPEGKNAASCLVFWALPDGQQHNKSSNQE